MKSIELIVNLFDINKCPNSQEEIQEAFADCLGHIIFAMGKGFMFGKIRGVGPYNLVCDWHLDDGTPVSVNDKS